MTSAFDSFQASPLGAFVQSPLDARGSGAAPQGLILFRVSQEPTSGYAMNVRAYSIVPSPWAPGFFVGTLNIVVPDGSGGTIVYAGQGGLGVVTPRTVFNGFISYRDCTFGALRRYVTAEPQYYDITTRITGNGSPWVLPDWSVGAMVNASTGVAMGWSGLDTACMQGLLNGNPADIAPGIFDEVVAT